MTYFQVMISDYLVNRGIITLHLNFIEFVRDVLDRQVTSILTLPTKDRCTSGRKSFASAIYECSHREHEQILLSYKILFYVVFFSSIMEVTFRKAYTSPMIDLKLKALFALFFPVHKP